MRTTHSTTGKTRRAPVATTLAAICLALPMSGFMGGTAFATSDKGNAADHGNSSAPGQEKKAEPAPQPAPAPYTNQGGVTTGSNTTKYETVSDQKGSTYTGKGGGQPSGDIHSPQPYSNADQNNTGANDTSASNQYKSTRDGSPSLNGNGGGKQVGQPCAGCVGKADNKNPPGQYPNGTDHNAGYECDRNHGIGRSNPAHTGCTAGSTPTPTPTPKPTYCPGTTKPMPANGKCDEGDHNGGGTTYCPGTTKPMPANGKCDEGDHNGGGTTYCPGTTKPMPANGKCDEGGSNGGGGNKNGKWTICHATGNGGFVVITPNKNGVVHGHIGHQDGRDIIPPFSYNDHGTTVNYPGQNWTSAGQAFFKNGCKAPTTPVLCPNGQPMPISGICGGGGGGNVTCPNGSAMPASGNIADCNPPVVCPAGTTMLNGSCTPPVTCPAGTTMAPGNGSCNPPVVCPAGSMVGPIVPGTMRPGCEVSGGGQAPGTTPTPGVISNGGNPQPVLGGTPTPAVVTARPTALPFTGGNAGVLAQGAALMLLIGGGLVLATRRKAVVAG